MKTNENQSKLMKVNENTLKSMNINKNKWKQMKTEGNYKNNRILIKSIKHINIIDGNQWISIETNDETNENPQTRLKTNENQCKASAPSSQIGQLYTRWQPAGRQPRTKPGRNACNEASHTINKIDRPLGATKLTNSQNHKFPNDVDHNSA